MHVTKDFIRKEEKRRKRYQELGLAIDQPQDYIDLKWAERFPKDRRDYGLSDDVAPLPEEING